ncbi:MAG TPA: imidazolonepropionase [Ferruginibacter sp.]|jgi:imidazolonepropionase|nr:imidazolonepropionase [Chitinophagaceae bacterium]MBP6046324.1 imidazolonepropionase [Ferruginibacter sp.]MBK7347112.1 imidazolonepropionase [Chitinophagaceae bacterium]MBK9957862.1 imidazolonepropionase [Chitinophagaceae bacterium]MBP6988609.1 imidazolonepropionase [Ferruginibacter sp.]
MTVLFTHISKLINSRETYVQLRGKALADLPCIADAYLLVEDGLIAGYGPMYELELRVPHLPKNVVDIYGQMILPCWCDSHTHIVFAGSRENEFIDKINGLSYAEIAAKGGGILNSAKKLNENPEEELFQSALKRLNELAALGTGAIEIKSGYGLTVEAELKMLRVIKRLKQQSDVTIKSTFLGAHTYPAAFKENHEGYIRQIIDEMLPVIAAEKLADYIDVFCETGFFSPDEMIKICKAGAFHQLKPKLHVNQLNSIGAIEAGIKLGAVSLDHLETVTEEEIQMLGSYKGCSTLLPTAAFFLRMPFQPARKLIDAGAAVTLASDFNPGSSPSGNMNLVNAMSCIQMKMLPEEVINASTLNGAYAMELENELGSITIGKAANLIFTKPIPSLAYLFYSFGSNHIDKVMLKGNWVQ